MSNRVQILVLGRVQVWHVQLSPGCHGVSLTWPLVAPLPTCLETLNLTLEFGVAVNVGTQVGCECRESPTTKCTQEASVVNVM